MHTFDKQQTYTKATIVDFDYDLYDIMDRKKPGDIITADNGNQFKVFDSFTTPCYFDTDSLIVYGPDFKFKPFYGVLQVVQIKRYYKPSTFENAHYRKEKAAYTIRIK